MKQKSNIKHYYKDNALILILEFLTPFVFHYFMKLIFDDHNFNIIIAIICWYPILYPQHLNNAFTDFPKWNGKLENNEKIIFTSNVMMKYLYKFKYDLLITNKNVILKNIYGVEKYNIKLPLEKVLRIEIEKNKIVLKFKFYTEIRLHSENPELIKNEFDKIKSNLLANNEEKIKELA